MPDVRSGHREKKAGGDSLGTVLPRLSGEVGGRVYLISSLSRKTSAGLKLFELILFPSCCQICSKPLELSRERVVCRDCLDSLKNKNVSFCLCCGLFFENSGGQPRLCGSCLQEKPPFSLHRSCGRYREKLKDLILLFKYRGYRVLSKDLSGFMLDTLGSSDEIWWGVDALIPVPLHPKRKRERGYNQASLLARELARAKGKVMLKKNLVRIDYRPPQTLVEAQNREKNVKGAFALRNMEEIKGKTILLVDDVFTTGATLKECCRELVQGGAKEIKAITVAQA